MSDEHASALNLPEQIRLRSDIAMAISQIAHISPLAAARIVSAIERGEIPALQINYEATK